MSLIFIFYIKILEKKFEGERARINKEQNICDYIYLMLLRRSLHESFIKKLVALKKSA
ncbi:MAG: hypothetical protein ACRCSK_00250 [Fusobacteriaceae bacterium]